MNITLDDEVLAAYERLAKGLNVSVEEIVVGNLSSPIIVERVRVLASFLEHTGNMNAVAELLETGDVSDSQ